MTATPVCLRSQSFEHFDMGDSFFQQVNSSGDSFSVLGQLSCHHPDR